MITTHFYLNVNHHWSLRNSKIDTVTIHCAVGLASSLSIARYLDTMTTDCSANYTIGKDGDITTMIPEKYRSWCSSNTLNDDRAITIEVASEADDPFKVPTLAMAALLDLLVDICSRHGFKLLWSWDANDRRNHIGGCNMTVHRDYAAKSCPGDFLYDNMQVIADTVNRRLYEMVPDSVPRYKTLAEIPEVYRDYISSLVEDNIILGRSSDNLDLSDDMCRIITIIFRMHASLANFYGFNITD